jgi:hypothetical protein
MINKPSLTGNSEKCCPQCGNTFVLAGPTDVLAIRPVQIDLVCPECHFPGRATLTEGNHLKSVFPSPDASNPLGVAQDSAGWLAATALKPHPLPAMHLPLLSLPLFKNDASQQQGSFLLN